MFYVNIAYLLHVNTKQSVIVKSSHGQRQYQGQQQHNHPEEEGQHNKKHLVKITSQLINVLENSLGKPAVCVCIDE